MFLYLENMIVKQGDTRPKDCSLPYPENQYDCKFNIDLIQEFKQVIHIK